MTKEMLEELFRISNMNTDERLKYGCEKTVELVQDMRKYLFEVEQNIAKVGETNSCENMIAAVENAVIVEEMMALLKNGIINIHNDHIHTAPQHERHRKAGRNHRGPLH